MNRTAECGVLLIAVLLPCAGCITKSRTQVQVRDPASVTLETLKGETVLPRGTSSAIVDRGSFGFVFPKAYEVRAEREPTGSIVLHCDTCEALNGNLLEPTIGRREFELLDANGQSRPVFSHLADVGNSNVSLSFDECMVKGAMGKTRLCRVAVPVRLVTPTTDVVEVRRHVEPVRFLGYLMLVGGAVFLAWGTDFLVRHPDDEARWSAVFFVPGVALSGFGLGQVLAPEYDQLWRPPATSNDR